MAAPYFALSSSPWLRSATGRRASKAFAPPHVNYEDDGISPVAVLVNDGYAMEMHVHIVRDFLGAIVQYNLTYHLGMLNPVNTWEITWSDEHFLRRTPRRSGLSAAGTYAVATPGTQTGDIQYTWAIAP